MASPGTSLITDLVGVAPPKPKLLVVDDQPLNIQVLYHAFSGDHQVFMATSGEQALAMCLDNPPDLVLLDVVMPGMDGFEVCRRLKAEDATRDIPVIFVTAHNDVAEETRGLDVGAVDFIAKPINPKVVRARVKTHLTLKFQSDLLRQMAFRDGLTGVFNRRYFDEHLEAEWRRATRNGSCLSLILIDVDYFKRYNDHYGHQVGDECLRQVAATLRAALGRGGDFVARYGGEEFACILADASFPAALDFAHRLEQAVRALAVEHAASDVAPVVTVSLGLAAKPPNCQASMADLLALADAQLYRAKHSGRARACGAALPEAPATGSHGGQAGSSGRPA